MNFSIVIPVYNIRESIAGCLYSIISQKSEEFNFEIIVVDDSSTDTTYEVVKSIATQNDNIRLFKTEKNSGPGIARNIGVENALGDWVMFVDGDDSLSELALSRLFNHIKRNDENLLNKPLDIVSFNFIYDKKSNLKVNAADGRTDIKSLYKNKEDLLQDYLSLTMDGSVIFTLMKRDLLKSNNILFSGGVHEDVDFMFKVYCLSQNIGVLNQPLYIKNNREDSIVNTISEKHIEGFFRAYHEIFDAITLYGLSTKPILDKYALGVVGACATRVRDISSRKNIDHEKLYLKLFTEVNSLIKKKEVKIDDKFKTKYIQIYEFFMSEMQSDNAEFSSSINDFLDKISKESWSCYDLHNSLFLAPDEVRTCCKRFFVDNKIKGDVQLLTKENYEYQDFNATNIMDEKQALWVDINKGFSDKCGGCPYLEFKEWGDLKVEHISFEYHSMCNMKCTYCSDMFYGGQKPQYDIEGLIDSMEVDGLLENCKSIVWGGGEPTLEKSFTPLLNKIKLNFPDIQQRVITNATSFNKDVADGLSKDQVSIVTSIDAGSDKTFFEVRKHRSFEKVFSNLARYSSKTKSENITIKYIFLESNSHIEEVQGFINMVKKYELSSCNFQVSYDFKEEFIDYNSLLCIVVIYGLLRELNPPLVFLDDLLINRLKKTNIDYEKIYYDLKVLGYEGFLPSKKYKNIVIWGAGKQAEYLLKDSSFLKQCEIAYLVDNTPSKIGTSLMGYEIFDPSILLNNDFPVLISAVQSSPKILKQYKALGLDETRLMKDLIL